VEDRFDHADALRDDGEYAAAIEAYDAIGRDLDDASGTVAYDAIARALIAKGGALRELGLLDEAQHAFDLVVERFGDSDEADLEAQVARALVRKAWAYRADGSLERAAAVSGAAVARYESASDSDVRFIVGLALATQLECLAGLGRPREAIEVARELADFAEGAYDSKLAALGTKARYNEAVCLGRLGRNDEALERYREILDGQHDGDDELIVEDVLRAAINAAHTLWGLRRADQAETLLERAMERFADEPGTNARRFLACAMGAEAGVFAGAGRREEAIEVCDRLISMLDGSEDHDLRRWIVYALEVKGACLWHARALAGYAAARRSVFDRFWNDPDRDLRHKAAIAATDCTGTLCRLGEGAILLDVLRAIVDRFDESDDEFLWARGRGASYTGNVLRPIVGLSGDRTRVLVACSATARLVRRVACACRRRLP
jgi:tetratricopeptide (TPR) repeat protein